MYLPHSKLLRLRTSSRTTLTTSLWPTVQENKVYLKHVGGQLVLAREGMRFPFRSSAFCVTEPMIVFFSLRIFPRDFVYTGTTKCFANSRGRERGERAW